jgi:2-dehydropantoate 2-reductase
MTTQLEAEHKTSAPPLRVAIMGAGAVGLLYGGWLQAAGADVTFIARGERLRDLLANPLVIDGRFSCNLPKVNAVSSAHIAPVDVLILATKLYDLEAATVAALPALAPDGIAVAVQNGISAYRVLREHLPVSRIAVGPVYAVARMSGPAAVAYGGIERVLLGNPEGPLPATAQKLVELWRKIGIDASAAEDINNVLWTKFVGLATSAALNCVARLPAAVVYHDPLIMELAKQSIAEVIAVGEAEGVRFDDDAAAKIFAFLQSLPPDTIASMRRDLDAGRRLELEGLSGEVMRLGQKHSVLTPLHSMTYALLRPFSNGAPVIAHVPVQPSPHAVA